MKHLAIRTLLVFYCAVACTADDSENDPNSEASDGEISKPYHYKYTVKDDEKQLFFDQSESDDEKGKVTGKYSVLQPDGRLRTVEYVASKEDGFVPKISYKDLVDPFEKDSDNEVI